MTPADLRSDLAALAERFMNAIVKADGVVIRDEVYTDNTVVWHNYDSREQPGAENIRSLMWLARNIQGLRYEEIRRNATAYGFVQQHVLRGTAPDGSSLEVPTCLVVTVTDGRISRIDDYLDSAAVESLLRP